MVDFTSTPIRSNLRNKQRYDLGNADRGFLIHILHGNSNQPWWKRYSNRYNPSERCCTIVNHLFPEFVYIDQWNCNDNGYADIGRRYAYIVVCLSITPIRSIVGQYDRCDQWNTYSDYIIYNLHDYGNQHWWKCYSSCNHPSEHGATILDRIQPKFSHVGERYCHDNSHSNCIWWPSLNVVDFAFVASRSLLLSNNRCNFRYTNRDFIVNLLHNHSNKRWW